MRWILPLLAAAAFALAWIAPTMPLAITALVAALLLLLAGSIEWLAWRERRARR